MQPRKKPTPERDAGGRFIGGDGARKDGATTPSSPTTAGILANGRGVGDALGHLASVVERAVAGSAQIDPALQAANEVGDIAGSIKSTVAPVIALATAPFRRRRQQAAEDRQEGWLRKIWRTLTRQGADETAYRKAEMRVLQEIERKPAAGDESGGGWLLRFLPLLLGPLSKLLAPVMALIGLFGKLAGGGGMPVPSMGGAVGKPPSSGSGGSAGGGGKGKRGGGWWGKAKGAVGRLPILGGVLSLLGFGYEAMQNESLPPEQRRKANYKAGGSAAGGLLGGTLGMAVGPLGSLVGAIIGDKVGGMVGEWLADVDWGDVGQSIVGTVQAGWRAVTDLFGTTPEQIAKTWNTFTEGMAARWNMVVDGLSAGWDVMLEKAGSVWSSITKKGRAVRDRAVDWASRNVVEPIAESKPGKALKAAHGKAVDWTSRNIIEPVAEGGKKIGAMAGEAWSGIKGTVSDLIHMGESKRRGYNDYNRGSDRSAASNKANLDLENMTIGEIMAKQELPKGDQDRLFAVGKYQVIPQTMQDAVKSLKLDPSQKFDAATQERIFSDFLATSKKGRGALENYIKTGKGSAEMATHAIAQEWASVESPKLGRGVYDGVGTNRAHVRAGSMVPAVETARAKYAELRAQGLGEQEAYAAALGATATQNPPQQVQQPPAPPSPPAPPRPAPIPAMPAPQPMESLLPLTSGIGGGEQSMSLTVQAERPMPGPGVSHPRIAHIVSGGLSGEVR